MRWELQRFPRLVRAAGPTPDELRPRSVTAVHLTYLRQHLAWEKATFALHFAALRQFLAWAENPLAGRKSVWRLPSGDATHRRWLTKEQFLRLYRSAGGPSRLLIALEGLNGLRRVEVLRLRVRDVVLAEGTMRVLGKGAHGGKWRTIPLHPEVQRVLTRVIRHLPDEARLFPRSRSYADGLLQKAAARAGFGRDGIRVSHHDLRRTFGRLAHTLGMDLVQLKNLYGHASIEQTVHYIGLDADRMRSGLVKLGRLLDRRPGARAGRKASS